MEEFPPIFSYPTPSFPQINFIFLLKLAQIWPFQYKNGKFWRASRAFFHAFKNFCCPSLSPQNFVAGADDAHSHVHNSGIRNVRNSDIQVARRLRSGANDSLSRSCIKYKGQDSNHKGSYHPDVKETSHWLLGFSNRVHQRSLLRPWRSKQRRGARKASSLCSLQNQINDNKKKNEYYGEREKQSSLVDTDWCRVIWPVHVVIACCLYVQKEFDFDSETLNGLGRPSGNLDKFW